MFKLAMFNGLITSAKKIHYSSKIEAMQTILVEIFLSIHLLSIPKQRLFVFFSGFCSTGIITVKFQIQLEEQ